MEIPIYPTVHASTDTDFPEAFETNTVRITLTTCVPHELLDRVGHEILAELLGRVREIVPQEQRGLPSGG